MVTFLFADWIQSFTASVREMPPVSAIPMAGMRLVSWCLQGLFSPACTGMRTAQRSKAGGWVLRAQLTALGNRRVVHRFRCWTCCAKAARTQKKLLKSIYCGWYLCCSGCPAPPPVWLEGLWWCSGKAEQPHQDVTIAIRGNCVLTTRSASPPRSLSERNVILCR